MKKMKFLTAFLSALTAVSLATASFAACAEDPTEPAAPTEAVTEAPTEAETEAPTEAETEAPTEASTEGATETPTEAEKELAIEAYRELFLELFGDASDEKFEAEFGVPVEEITEEMIENYINNILEGVFIAEEPGTWSGSGNFTVTLPLDDPTYDLGAFVGLTDENNNPIGTASAANGNVTITVNESALKAVTPGESLLCFAEFENGIVVYEVNIPAKSANTNTGAGASSTANTKTASPKTGVKGVGLAAALLTVSGAAAFISRKKNK